MARGVDINGMVLRQLREDRGWTTTEFIEHTTAEARAKGDRQFALDRHQLCRHEHNRLRPSLRTLEHMLAALKPTLDELRQLLAPTERLASLLQLVRELRPQAKAEHAEAEHAEAEAEEDPQTDRRQIVIKAPLAVAAYVALPHRTDPLRAEIDAVTGAYATSSPQRLLPRARRLLDKIMRALREPMRDGTRRRLLVDASEVAVVAARMALFGGHPGEADAYFTQALKFADQSGGDRVHGCALAQSALLHDLLMGDGDSGAALGLLQAAKPLIGSDGPLATWVAINHAKHSAARSDDSQAMRLLERAGRVQLSDDGQGLYSLRGLFAGFDERTFAAESGNVLARLGRSDEALELFHGELSEPNANPRRSPAVLGDIALAHAKGGKDPEPACKAAIQSLRASRAVGYTVGTDRILKVRDQFPPAWTRLACVRELDDHLAALT